MPGILYVVATPIGNLEDVTLRALRVLRDVSLIAAEDTRRTAKLLQHYSISTPATSLHEHNEYARTGPLIDRLRLGESIALVSDAGTPGISDPGSRLIAAAHEAGIVVQPVPGPSAVGAMVSASGIGGDGFVFVGFAPPRSNARKAWLRNYRSMSLPLVAYEAPHRIHALLQDIQDELGERQVAVGRELTKLHENLAVRPISAWLADPPPELGEFVLVIGPPSPVASAEVSDLNLAEAFHRHSSAPGSSRREALKAAAHEHGVSPRRVFQAVEACKNLDE